MFQLIWHTLFFDPIYNGLVFFIDFIPGGDVGLAVIVVTVIVKTAMLPLSLKALRAQRLMKELEPQLAEIKERLKDKKEQLSREMMALYASAGVNPFASILLMFIQIPIVIALYLAVNRGGGHVLPTINTDVLYSFIPKPEIISMHFLGLINIASRSIPLALLAGVTQFLQTKYALPATAPKDTAVKPNFKDDFARSMQFQMRYGMPLIIMFVSYSAAATVALYFIASNIIGLVQELVVRRTK